MRTKLWQGPWPSPFPGLSWAWTWPYTCVQPFWSPGICVVWEDFLLNSYPGSFLCVSNETTALGSWILPAGCYYFCDALQGRVFCLSELMSLSSKIAQHLGSIVFQAAASWDKMLIVLPGSWFYWNCKRKEKIKKSPLCLLIPFPISTWPPS